MISPVGSYLDAYRQSLDDPETFWLTAARVISWEHLPSRVLDGAAAPVVPDGVLNACYNALDRHAEGGRGEQPALIYDS